MKNETGLDGSAPNADAPLPKPAPLRVHPAIDPNSTEDDAPPAKRDAGRTVGRPGTTHGRALDSWSTRERGRGRG